MLNCKHTLSLVLRCECRVTFQEQSDQMSLPAPAQAQAGDQPRMDDDDIPALQVQRMGRNTTPRYSSSQPGIHCLTSGANPTFVRLYQNSKTSQKKVTLVFIFVDYFQYTRSPLKSNVNTKQTSVYFLLTIFGRPTRYTSSLLT